MNILRHTATHLVALCALASPMAAWADTMTWRLATVTSTMQAGETLRKGVAIFDNGQPAFVSIRLRPTAPPAQGSMPFTTETEYRFEDGSTFTVRGSGISRMSPEGVPIPGETRVDGSFASGTGRFSGIRGTVVLRSVSGLSRMTDGVLGEQFGEGQADYTLAR